MIMALVLLLTLFTVPVMAEEGSNDEPAIGLLPFLNLSEEEMLSRKSAEHPAYDYLIEHGVMELNQSGAPFQKVVFYDPLDSMLMGLISGEVDTLNVPDCTAKYLEYFQRDMPEGTVITAPYYSDLNVLVTLK